MYLWMMWMSTAHKLWRCQRCVQQIKTVFVATELDTIVYVAAADAVMAEVDEPKVGGASGQAGIAKDGTRGTAPEPEGPQVQ